MTTIEPRELTAERFWIVFDGPPGPQPGRFVEVENDRHEGRGPSQTGAAWQQDSNVFWRLGPFVSEAALLHAEAQLQSWQGTVGKQLRGAAMTELPDLTEPNGTCDRCGDIGNPPTRTLWFGINLCPPCFRLERGRREMLLDALRPLVDVAVNWRPS